jgi:hypothetical protein
MQASGTSGSHVALDRHFRELSAKELEDPEALASYNHEASWTPSLGWKSLLEKKRVVVLAAAGSGKTHEMQQQQLALSSEGKCAFYASLEELADTPFEDLLFPESQIRFRKWKDDILPAWFFLDAVDELKLKQKTFLQALRRMRQAIEGHQDRAHIIVSSRPTDWFLKDQQVLQEALPPPVIQLEDSASLTGEEAFVRAIKDRDRSSSGNSIQNPTRQNLTYEAVYCTLLLPLADKQVRAFAQRRGVKDADRFLQEISNTNSWLFARRPLDLIDLIANWNAKDSLGTRQEQHEFNVISKLRDKDGRSDADKLTDTRAREGAERLALSMVLVRTRSVKSPDYESPPDAEGRVLDAAAILPDWTPEQRSTLLRRALFDPATFGRVRFHHRSVQEYLAAKRLHVLRRSGMSIKALFGLLFAEKYGEHVVLPSMRPVAAWLAIWNDDVLQKIIACEPSLLLEHGDPASLSVQARSDTFRAIVKCYGSGGWRGLQIPLEQVERAAHPDLAPGIIKCWGRGPKNMEVRDLLLDLIWKSRPPSCLPIARKVACRSGEVQRLRRTAVKIFSACSSGKDLAMIAEQIQRLPADWPPELVSEILEDLFPKYLGITELITQLERKSEKRSKEFYSGFALVLSRLVENRAILFDRGQLRQSLTELVLRGVAPDDGGRIRSRYASLCTVIARICLSELDTPNNDKHAPDLIRSCVVAARLSKNDYMDVVAKPLRERLVAEEGLREEIFWEELALTDKFILKKDSWSRFYHTWSESLIQVFKAEDEAWLVDAIKNPQHPLRHEVAVHGLVYLWAALGRKRSRLPVLKARLGRRADLIALFEARTKKPSVSDLKAEREGRKYQKEYAKKEARRVQGWKLWRKKILKNPRAYFTSKALKSTIHNIGQILFGLSFSSNAWAVWNHDALTGFFDETVADLAKESFQQGWRKNKPLMLSERKPEECQSTPYAWIYGMWGIMAEAEDARWTEKLTSEEARLAVRYATVELNRFAPFLTDLANRWPNEVADVLGAELEAAFLHGGAGASHPVLDKLTNAEPVIKRLLSSVLFRFLEEYKLLALGANASQGASNLGDIINILSSSADSGGLLKVADICGARFKESPKAPLALTWLRGLFRMDSTSGLDLLLKVIEGQRDLEAGKYVARMLTGMFGAFDNIGVQIKGGENIADMLGRLTRCAYKYIAPRSEEDGETGSENFNSQYARSFFLNYLIETPGGGSHRVLLELSRESDFAGISDRLRHLAWSRAAKDSEFTAWGEADIVKLEKQHELPPHDRDTLHQMMMNRLEDLQHELTHDDMTDRSLLATIKKESEMQRSLGQKLRDKARGMYQVTREEEVADGKNPDFRLLSNSGMVKAAIELKIAHRWTLKELENALKTQLTKQYLRDEGCPSGCLLLTYNGSRKLWRKDPKVAGLNFTEVVAHLQRMAAKIETERDYTIKVAVFGLDLTASYLK